MAAEPTLEQQAAQPKPEPIRPMNGAWTAERLDELNQRVENGFDKVDKRFDKIDERFETEFAKVDKRFDKVEAAIGELNRTLMRVGGGMIVALMVGLFFGG